jgi:hypothetical protein
VFGYDAGSGTPLAASVGSRSHIAAVLIAPHGTLSLASGVAATGAFAAFDIGVADQVQVSLEGALPTSSDLHGSQQLSGYRTGPLIGAPLLGPAPPDLAIRVAIGLPFNDQAGLMNAIQQISDPTSAQYRHFLDLPTFTSKYGATIDQYDSVASFAQTHNLAIVQKYATQLYMTMAGTVSQLEQAFYANMNYYQRLDGSQFYALDTQPSLDLSTPILRVTGLENWILSQASYGPPPPQPTPSKPVPTGPPGTGPGGGLWGLDYRSAYFAGTACNALLGDGQTIAIYSEDNYNYSDIALYANKSGLSALRPFLGQGTQDPYPITNTVDCNQQVLTGCGGGGGICTGCLPHAVFSAEAVTDIDVAMSVAPHAAIYNYQNGNYLAGADGFLWGAASQAVPFGQITSSYRGDYDGNGGQAIEALVARGTTYFYATGDGGAFSSAYPYNYGVAPSLAGLAGVGATLVGATALVANYPPKGTPFLSETCLPQSTGGILGGGHISGYDAWNWGDPYTGPVETPGFQLDYVDSSNTSISYTFRNVPDVSAIGANAT